MVNSEQSSSGLKISRWVAVDVHLMELHIERWPKRTEIIQAVVDDLITLVLCGSHVSFPDFLFREPLGERDGDGDPAAAKGEKAKGVNLPDIIPTWRRPCTHLQDSIVF
jgi:hypothetical protein